MISSENIHIWKNTQGHFVVSNENTKQLLAYPTKDGAINALFMRGHQATARELHHNKQL